MVEVVWGGWGGGGRVLIVPVADCSPIRSRLSPVHDTLGEFLY